MTQPRWTALRVEFLSRIGHIAGTDHIELDIAKEETVGSMLERLCDKFGDKFRQVVLDEKSSCVRQQILIMVNGDNIFIREGLLTRLSKEDVLQIVEAVGGG